MLNCKQPKFGLRRAMVLHAMAYGTKPASRHFGCSRNTVRTWLRRFREHGNDGLRDHSRAPLSCPHKKTGPLAEEVKACRKSSGFGAARLVAEYRLPISKNAAHRILREENLIQPRQRKYKRKKDLRAIKAAYPAFSRFQMDTKDLSDIPHYWPQIQRLGLPRYQYTIRELSTGATFLSFSSTLSKTWSTLTIRRLLQHIQQAGIDLSQVRVTTDLGTEFDGETRHYRPDGYHGSIVSTGAEHRFNPPSCPNANADVESFHATIEAEFFDRETFADKDDFLLKTNTYQSWFNLARFNRSRAGSPLDRLQAKQAPLSGAILLLPPFIAERSFPTSGGQHVPGSPESVRDPLRFTLSDSTESSPARRPVNRPRPPGCDGSAH